jgi:hypothetical protein
MNRLLLTIQLFMYSLIVTGCYITKGTGKGSKNGGEYRYSILKGTGTDRPVIYGTFSEFEVDKIIPLGYLRSNKDLLNKLKTDGSFSFTVPSGEYSFETRALTYSICKTKKFKLKDGDTLRLDFRIKNDRSKLY